MVSSINKQTRMKTTYRKEPHSNTLDISVKINPPLPTPSLKPEPEPIDRAPSSGRLNSPGTR